MIRVLGIVPARGGSKRVPRKNLRPLGGKPLVQWAIEAANGATRLDAVVVSSDDEEILALADSAGAHPLVRPPNLSTDAAPAIDYVLHALDDFAARGESAVEIVVIVQPTSPFTLPGDIDDVVRLLESTDADSAVSVMRVEHAVHPIKLKRLDGDRLVAYLEEERGRMAEIDLPAVYVRNGSVYASRCETIASGSLLGGDSRAVIMPADRSLDINDEMDLEFAEFLLSRGNRGHHFQES